MCASTPDNPDAVCGQTSTKRHLPGLTLAELRTWLTESGEAKYRAEQILNWIYDKHAGDFDAMTSLSKNLRETLANRADVFQSQVIRDDLAADQTRKLLLEWPDGARVETVWIPDGQRHTVCVSSQVGCPVGCAFCASGLNGVERNLTAGEIVEQALRVAKLVTESGAGGDEKRPPRLSNVVLMGMGEPLANYKEVVKAIRILNASWGLNIGARKITLSTVGLPKQIRQLAEEDLQLNLALSLHAPDDELRRELIPWGKVPLEELLRACACYFERTGREITLEYVLLSEVNDHPRHALGLAKIAKRLRANVNLIRYNPVPGTPYDRPSAENAFKFQKLLQERGVNVHVRKSRGKEISAACGQLRRSTPLKPPGE